MVFPTSKLNVSHVGLIYDHVVVMCLCLFCHIAIKVSGRAIPVCGRRAVDQSVGVRGQTRNGTYVCLSLSVCLSVCLSVSFSVFVSVS